MFKLFFERDIKIVIIIIWVEFKFISLIMPQGLLLPWGFIIYSYKDKKQLVESNWWDFPGGSVFKTLCSQSRGTGSIPSRGTKISHAEPAQPKKKKQLNLYYGVLNNI